MATRSFRDLTAAFPGRSLKGASIDKDTPVESANRDADLRYELHQPDYFRSFELAGVVDFEGRR